MVLRRAAMCFFGLRNNRGELCVNWLPGEAQDGENWLGGAIQVL